MSLITNQRWFEERLAPLPQSAETKAYVAGVFNKFIVSLEDDMSKESIVLAYDKAVETGDFVRFQRIGDWTLWVHTFAPVMIKNHMIIETIGRMSYSTCFRIMRGQWKVYEELADDLPRLTRLARNQLVVK